MPECYAIRMLSVLFLIVWSLWIRKCPHSTSLPVRSLFYFPYYFYRSYNSWILSIQSKYSHSFLLLFAWHDSHTLWAGELSRYSDWLRAGRSGIESRWGRDFSPVQTGPGAHPASCKMGTGSFPWVHCGRGVLLTTHPLLVPRSWKSRAIPLPTPWATPGL